jgi:hypothetical protein
MNKAMFIYAKAHKGFSKAKGTISLFVDFLNKDGGYSGYLELKNSTDKSLLQALLQNGLDNVLYYLAVGGLLCFPLSAFFGVGFSLRLIVANAVAYWLLKKLLLLLRNGK